MSLLLTLEHGPRNQAVRQTRLDQGQLVIGRSAEADWQIDDPDMFVSRAHCTISAHGDGYVVTDTSSSGLFVDGAGTPLGAGNSAQLRNGMRLRLGDYVVGVEVERNTVEGPGQFDESLFKAVEHAARPSAPAAARTPASLGGDDFFSVKSEEAPRAPRPAELPDPFEKARPSSFDAFERSDADRHKSPAFDDPFSLEPVATPDTPEAAPARNEARFDDPFGFGSASPPPIEPARPSIAFSDGLDFELPPAAKPAPLEATPPVAIPAASKAAGVPAYAPWEMPPTPGDETPVVSSAEAVAEPAAPIAEVAPAPRSEPRPVPEARPAPMPDPRPAAVPMPEARARLQPSAPRRSEPAADTELYAAFLSGLGVDVSASGADPVAEMEKFGREYRLMMEGLMQLLRKRAEEKGNARVAQTVVGASEVNPLKFMPTVDDAMAIMLRGNSPGFLGGEAAIADSVRDLASHHVRAWRGVQGALRRMIDRFDPAALEEELKSNSGIGTILTGGKSAKLWELYRKRHREIAQSAENRFLGEIGADFRDAYEEE